MTKQNNLAYDLERYQPQEIQKEIEKELKVLSAPKQKVKISYFTMVSLFVLGIASVAVVVFMKAELTELSSQMLAAQKDLGVLHSEEVRLQVQMENIVSKQNIEEKAGRLLGIGKEDPSQVTYISLAKESGGIVAGGKETFFTKIQYGFSNLWEYMESLFNNNIEKS